MLTTLPQRNPSDERGFTLIEVMIVVAILGLIAAIAIPNYSSYINRARRTEAQTALQDAAQFMQRFYAANNRYDTSVSGTNVSLPVSLRTIPANSSGAATYYTLTVLAAANTYTLTATPSNVMASDACGAYTLVQTGARGSLGSLSVAQCWR